jgi:hypothetical protein
LAGWPLYFPVLGTMRIKQYITYLISLSRLQQSLRQRGKTSPEKTDRGYELRSRGPAIRGFNALDRVLLQVPCCMQQALV